MRSLFREALASFFLSVLQLDVLNGFAQGSPHRGVSHGASQEIGAVVRQYRSI